MQATERSGKVGRNEPCPCGSGQKYKFCCVGKNPRTRIVELDSVSAHWPSPIQVDVTHDLFNRIAAEQLPLKNFCKEQGFYYFSVVTVAEHLQLMEELAAGTLTRERVMALYRARTSQDAVIGLIAQASNWSDHFSRRRDILSEAAEVHFQGKYTVSIPTLFAQIEGLLRDIGGLNHSAKFKSTVPVNGWNSRLMFSTMDDAEYFNAFVNRLFEGQQSPDTFGRNAVLHGINTGYSSEDASLMLILAVLEIRTFLWLRSNTSPLIRGAKE